MSFPGTALLVSTLKFRKRKKNLPSCVYVAESTKRHIRQFHVAGYDDDHKDEFSFLFLNLNKILENSTPGKVACI